MKNEHILILTSTDTKKNYKLICEKLLNEKSCACISIIPKMKSLYFWNNKLQKNKEWLLLIKTTSKFYKKIESILLEYHKYEIPEIISFKIDKGYEKYLKWISSQVAN
jgi:uncharacterized protein involved in tolerance to divalent cations|tara:strand:- start:989 stop:1312 length:324 start_codon:yes stop_codon:yes gene_type:complete